MTDTAVADKSARSFWHGLDALISSQTHDDDAADVSLCSPPPSLLPSLTSSGPTPQTPPPSTSQQQQAMFSSVSTGGGGVVPSAANQQIVCHYLNVSALLASFSLVCPNVATPSPPRAASGSFPCLHLNVKALKSTSPTQSRLLVQFYGQNNTSEVSAINQLMVCVAHLPTSTTGDSQQQQKQPQQQQQFEDVKYHFELFFLLTGKGNDSASSFLTSQVTSHTHIVAQNKLLAVYV